MNDTQRIDWIEQHTQFTYEFDFGGKHWIRQWLCQSESPNGRAGQYISYGSNFRECVDNFIINNITFIG